MTPLNQILRLYAKHGGSFGADLREYFETGYVFVTPDFFLMGKRVDDYWLVFAAAGDMAKMLDAIPFPLPRVAWSRRGKPLRFYRLESIIRHARRSLA